MADENKTTQEPKAENGKGAEVKKYVCIKKCYSDGRLWYVDDEREVAEIPPKEYWKAC